MDDFRLRVFLAMVQEKNFTKAAALLKVSQPAVSHNVSELEKELGVKLFERLHGETILTSEGHVFMKYVEKFMNLSSEVNNLFSPLSATVVRISVSEDIYTYLLSKSLAEFSAVHPQVTFERTLFDDADLKFSLRPASGTPFDTDPDVIARVKVSLSAPVASMAPVAPVASTASATSVVPKVGMASVASAAPASGVASETTTVPAVTMASATSVVPKVGIGDIYATRETNAYFELVCQPTPPFACTKLYRILRNYLASALFSVTA